jgi:hypothetical protein
VVASGTNKNGVPQPTESKLYVSIKNWCSSAVPTPPCAVNLQGNGLTGIGFALSLNAAM